MVSGSRRVVRGLVAAALVVVGSGSGAGVAAGNDPGRYEGRIAAEGQAWRYHLHVPKVYDGRRALPLVLILHGSGVPGSAYLDQGAWVSKAEEAGFLVVAPEALPARLKLDPNPVLNPRRWNSGQINTRLPRSRVNDVRFFDALLDVLERTWQIDRDRIYAVGHSNGGSMAFVLASRRAERFAAIASVAGLCWLTDPQPSRPVPTLFVLGTEDPIVPLKGGMSILPWEVRKSPPVHENLRRWSVALGGPPEPDGCEHAPGVTVHTYGDHVTAVFVAKHGHGWPGGRGKLNTPMHGPDAGTVRATDLVWSFFETRGRRS